MIWIWRCVHRASYCNVQTTKEMHSSYKQFFYSTVFSCCTCFERITRSSSGTLPGVLLKLLERLDNSFIATRFSCTIVSNCVIQCTRQSSWWWTSNSFGTCRARKNGGIKIIYRNCASRWLSTHWNTIFFQIFTFKLWTQAYKFFVSRKDIQLQIASNRHKS